MRHRNWYLGLGAALAVLIPLTAKAAPVPNLIAGASAGDPMSAHFNGVTTEISGTIGSGDAGGSCAVAATATGCVETTWGVGTIDQVFNENSNAISWSDGTNGQSIAYVIYGIADQSVSQVVHPDGSITQTVKNTGADASFYGAGDGLIHIDLYYMPTSERPCFTTAASCVASGDQVTAFSRTPNVGSTAQVTNITDDGTLFASFSFQPGVDANGNVTMVQTVNIGTDGKVGSGGGSANFYGECASSANPGPGCSQFGLVPESAFGASTFFPDLIVQIFGEIGFKTANGSPNFFTPNSAGWLFATTDPVHFFAVPEPASLAVLGTSLVLLGVAARRRRNGSIS